jgi:probable rRNA maturation factor
VNVFFSDEQDEPVDGAGLRRFAEMVLTEEGLPGGTEMSLILVGASQIAEYNRRFMGREGPTDVLAFPLEELQPGMIPAPVANDPPLVLGDVFLCPSEIRRRAVAEGFAEEDFLYLLVVHGILHLLGYDHGDEEQAREMEVREDALLAMVGRSLA